MNLQMAIKKWEPLISKNIENKKFIEIFSIYMEWLNEKMSINAELKTYKEEIDEKINKLANHQEVKTFLNEITGTLEYRLNDKIYHSTNIVSDDTIKKIFGNDFYLFLIDAEYSLT